MALCVLVGALAVSGGAEARQQDQAAPRSSNATAIPQAPKAQQAALQQGNTRQAATATSQQRSRAQASSSGGISCVPYARAVTGMEISGNGVNWWGNAAGIYDRGQRPEPGAVMAFRASGNMPLGHVAVVSRVLGPRQVQIEHANWGGPGIRRGTVMKNVNVIDVSDHNDWSAVQVQSGYNSNAFGRTNQIFGFIYNRPDNAANNGTVYAGTAAHRSLRFEQVAEMPEPRAASPSGTIASQRR